MFFVYVLRSHSTKRFYTGQTSDLPNRILEHELGLSPSTKGRGPWELVHQETFNKPHFTITLVTSITSEIPLKLMKTAWKVRRLSALSSQEKKKVKETLAR